MSENNEDRFNPDNYKLQPEVAAKYTCKTYAGPINFKGMDYDLREISLEVATQLVKDGCDILIPLKPKAGR